MFKLSILFSSLLVLMLLAVLLPVKVLFLLNSMLSLWKSIMLLFLVQVQNVLSIRDKENRKLRSSASEFLFCNQT